MHKKLPLILTVSRIVLVPFIIIAMVSSSQWGGIIAAVLFVAGSITDYYDGYFARKYQVESVMGKFLDPIADKVLVTSTLIMLIPTGRLGPIMVIILMARDACINGLRSVAAAQNIVIAADPLGKWKTGFQMFAIPCVLVHTIPVPYLDKIPVYQIGYWIMWLSVILSVVSGYSYMEKYLKNRPLS